VNIIEIMSSEGENGVILGIKQFSQDYCSIDLEGYWRFE